MIGATFFLFYPSKFSCMFLSQEPIETYIYQSKEVLVHNPVLRDLKNLNMTKLQIMDKLKQLDSK